MHAAHFAPRLHMRAASGARGKAAAAAPAAATAAMSAAPPRAALAVASPALRASTRARRGAAVGAAASTPSRDGEAAPAPSAAGSDNDSSDAAAGAAADAAAAARYGLEGKAQGGAAAQLTLPTLLTLARVAAVPALLAGACAWRAWRCRVADATHFLALSLINACPPRVCPLRAVHFLSVPWASTASCVIFLLAALTDWLDGYLARKARAHAHAFREKSAQTDAHAVADAPPRRAAQMNLASAFGAFLDPVADKARARSAHSSPCTHHSHAHASSRDAPSNPFRCCAHPRPRAMPSQLMVAAALVLLSTAPPPVLASAPPWLIPAPAVAIIGREITMSGAHAKHPRKTPSQARTRISRALSAFQRFASGPPRRAATRTRRAR
jgi:hypothetical protein